MGGVWVYVCVCVVCGVWCVVCGVLCVLCVLCCCVGGSSLLVGVVCCAVCSGHYTHLDLDVTVVILATRAGPCISPYFCAPTASIL